MGLKSIRDLSYVGLSRCVSCADCFDLVLTFLEPSGDALFLLVPDFADFRCELCKQIAHFAEFLRLHTLQSGIGEVRRFSLS